VKLTIQHSAEIERAWGLPPPPSWGDSWIQGQYILFIYIYTRKPKLDLREVGIDGANWIQLAHDRFQWQAFVNTVMNLRVP
jgi:hypothetical protein